MASTITGALKQHIEGLGLALAVYKDKAPQGEALPYVTIQESISINPDLVGDNQLDTISELAQVDLWQAWKDDEGSVVENHSLKPALIQNLHGATVSNMPTQTYGITMEYSQRFLEEENNIIHDAITIRLRRKV